MSSVPHPSSLFPLLATPNGGRLFVCQAGEPRRWQPNTWLLLMFSPGGQFCRSFLVPPHPNTPISRHHWGPGWIRLTFYPPPPSASFGCEVMEAVRTRERERGRDGGGIYGGAAGPREGGRSIGPVAECRGNQPLITPAVVFTLLRASACLHSFAPEFALSPHQPHRSSLQPLPPAPLSAPVAAAPLRWARPHPAPLPLFSLL